MHHYHDLKKYKKQVFFFNLLYDSLDLLWILWTRECHLFRNKKTAYTIFYQMKQIGKDS